MRFSFEGNRAYRPGNPSGINPKNNRQGSGRIRRCLNCIQDMEDDGSVLFLRGFCSQKCLDTYLGLNSDGTRDGGYL